MAYKRYSSYEQNMGVPGVVYILKNSGLAPGWVKMGHSRHSGSKRAKDLNDDANTGTPGSFVCIYEHKTQDCGKAEKEAFKALSRFRAPTKKGQEYFIIDNDQMDYAKRIIKDVCERVDIEVINAKEKLELEKKKIEAKTEEILKIKKETPMTSNPNTNDWILKFISYLIPGIFWLAIILKLMGLLSK